MSISYYVVKKGYTPGIYQSWAECKRETDGYSGPIYRKFTSHIEATNFLNSKSIITSNYYSAKDNGILEALSNVDSGVNNSVSNATDRSIYLDTKKKYNANQSSNSKASKASKASESIESKAKSQSIKSEPFSDSLNYTVDQWTTINNELYIFTDGSSRKTQIYPNSGIGVYIGYNCTNIKEQYNDKTNNMCELIAIDYAFKLIIKYWKEIAELGKVIKIVSDSEYSIKACSIWLQKWKLNHWLTSNNEPVKNRDLIESIDNSMQRIKLINSKIPISQSSISLTKIKVKLVHVNSHQNEPNPDTDKINYALWFGNYIADGLSQNSM